MSKYEYGSMYNGGKSDTKELNTNETNSGDKVLRVLLMIILKKPRNKSLLGQ